ncbi:MAG TPA: retropepsin-like aspartic protease [Candidatus Nanoarchaeia archaeon]|nr:retropepsin-like aspartic protease [Candidatus Nanoarchaeia archaeon]
MTIMFRYKSVKRPDGSFVKAPLVQVTFIGKASFDTVALIDSGADISAMPRETAEILGLNLKGELSNAYGIGGKVSSVQTTTTVRIRKGHEDYRLLLPVKVILDNYDFPILLGRSGFFDNFIITFDEQEEKVMLKKRFRK